MVEFLWVQASTFSALLTKIYLSLKKLSDNETMWIKPIVYKIIQVDIYIWHKLEFDSKSLLKEGEGYHYHGCPMHCR